jgi:hypothetical protein
MPLQVSSQTDAPVIYIPSLRQAAVRVTQIDVAQDLYPWILITLPTPATIVEATTNALTALNLPGALIATRLATSVETAQLVVWIRNKEEP